MPRVKTFAAGGTLVAADLNGIQDDYEHLFTQGKLIGEASGRITNGLSPVGTYVVQRAHGNAISVTEVASSLNTANSLFYLDPADWTAGTRTVKVLIDFHVVSTLDLQTGAGLTFSLRPITTYTAGSQGMYFTAVGAAVTGSTLSPSGVPTPTDTGATYSVEFPMPTGAHVICATLGQSPASSIGVRATVYAKQA